MRTRLFRWLVFTALLTTAMIVLEGGYDRWLLLYCAGWSLLGLAAVVLLSDDLFRERLRPPVPGADRLPLRAVRLAALAHIVVGALDAGRWHLAPVPESWRAPALAFVLLSAGLVLASMRANMFFSSVVRIQADRGHHVVAHGPYAMIRHPGYLGMILAVPFSGIALGSWLSVALGVCYSALIVRRVWFEDGFLRQNLRGYGEYAGQVRFRLVPGLW